MTEETKLVIHSTTAKAVLKFSSEAWALKKRDGGGGGGGPPKKKFQGAGDL